ncbi:hypothetical protein ACJZ2D_007903 [Fusarium nematophilum]
MMNAPQNLLLRSLRASRRLPRFATTRLTPPPPKRPFTSSAFRRSTSKKQPSADDPDFVSILDGPPKIRLGWKTELLAKFEDRLVRDPLPLPPTIDPSAVHEFDYRRVTARGRFRHDQEMLIGPRMRDGTDGYMVVTPLEREGATTILVNRGWIDKKHRDQRTRPDGLPTGEVAVEGLLREPWKKNMFTPENQPEKGMFYFPDVKQMAELTGSQPVWVEATMEPEFMRMVDYEARGIPYGRPAEVNLRNNHAQYIFTWYGLCAATSIMLWMVIKKPSSDIARRVARSKGL